MSGDRDRARGQPKGIELDDAGSSEPLMEAASGLPDMSRPFTVLGIETSCDDTAVAIVRSDGTILGEAIAKQDDIHEEWGGVVPGLARDAHAAALASVIDEAVAAAGMDSVADVDAIGVTVGPGLEICLRVGCDAAVAEAQRHQKPFVRVHHLEAHCLLARQAALSSGEEPVDFPFLCLLVSGGHCQLLLCRGVGRFEVIGSTLDDALGEAYDKVARLLGLGVGGGGGPALEALALEGRPGAVTFPVPMARRKDAHFSFAGLKTAVRMRVQAMEDDDSDANVTRADIAAAFQDAAVSHLEQRLAFALERCDDILGWTPPSEPGGLEESDEEQRSVAADKCAPAEADAANEEKSESATAPEPAPRYLVVSGGVAANQVVRSRIGDLCASRGVRMVTPPPRLCTDNGVMVAWAAIERLRAGCSHCAEGTEVRARWPLGRALRLETAGGKDRGPAVDLASAAATQEGEGVADS